MKILLVNDDGIYASGLRSLYHALNAHGHQVSVVAPMFERSAASACFTLNEPLHIKPIKEDDFDGFAINGTPVDCVNMGLKVVCENETPDLVVSGINAGHNVGIELIYSGTFNAARQAALCGVHAIALSRWLCAEDDPQDVADYAAELIEQIRWSEIDTNHVVNVNFPPIDVKQYGLPMAAKLSHKPWAIDFERRISPTKGKSYYWYKNIPFQSTKDDASENTDVVLLDQSHITVTLIDAFGAEVPLAVTEKIVKSHTN